MLIDFCMAIDSSRPTRPNKKTNPSDRFPNLMEHAIDVVAWVIGE
jgi:hypothetical protein